ncbi:MAG: DUF2911 domain-containing protein [Gemmatimonadaceae bacterium]
MHIFRHSVALLLALAAASLSSTACAQAQQTPSARRSQRASVTQRVGAAEIVVAYSRPVARGRELFPGVVSWGRNWSPGADTATSVAFSADVLVNGQALGKGTYSIWMIPQQAEWTVIFSSAHPVWHVPYPEGKEVLRVPATPATGSHMEALAFYFPVVEPDSTVLNMHWGTTVVPLSIKVK